MSSLCNQLCCRVTTDLAIVYAARLTYTLHFSRKIFETHFTNMGIKLSRVAKIWHTKKQYEHHITILSGGLQKMNRKIGKFLTLHQELLKQRSSLGTLCTRSVIHKGLNNRHVLRIHTACCLSKHHCIVTTKSSNHKQYD